MGQSPDVLCALPRLTAVALALALACIAVPTRVAAEAPAPHPPAPEAAQESDELARLRRVESALASGAALSDDDRALPLTSLAGGSTARVRALAAAVAAWLEPTAAAGPLVHAVQDNDALVRGAALSSLVALSRRLEDGDREAALNAALAALDDGSDEVACSAVELVLALSPSAASDALRTRAAAASDVRYACFAPAAGLPPRTVELPPLPEDEADAPASAEPPAGPAAEERNPDGTWLLVAVGASAGAVAGGALPGAVVVSRDVLTYTPTRTRVVREEVSFGSQVAGALLGAGVGGASMWGLSLLGAPTVTAATSAALATGAAMLVGGGLQLSFALVDAPAVLALSGATTAGLAGGAALAAFGALTFDDHALALGMAGAGGLASLFTAFAVVPVGFDQVGDAFRSDFGFGVAALGAGGLGLLGLGLGVVVDVPARRTVAGLAGGVLLGGAGAGLAFAAIPGSLDVKSRIACGIGLGGQLAGTVLGVLLLPDGLFGAAPAPGTALHLNLRPHGDTRLVHVGIPAVAPLVAPPAPAGAGYRAASGAVPGGAPGASSPFGMHAALISGTF